MIANLRGTGGSGGEFTFFDAQERRDMYDLVEWAAAQPWCDGTIGMIGISYFAMTQLEAAVERPPHLKAIFPVAVTADLYEAACHHGLFSSSFVTPFLAMTGMTAERGDHFWRSPPVEAARKLLNTPALHRKFATMNGEAALSVFKALRRAPHPPSPGTNCGSMPPCAIRCAMRGGTSGTCCRCWPTSTSRSISAATGRTCRCICRRPSAPGST